jgi:hypothetical protein
MTTTDTSLPLLLIIAILAALLLSVGIYRVGVRVTEAATRPTRVKVTL